MNEITLTAAIALGSIGYGVLAGNIIVYLFNRLPDSSFVNPKAHTHEMGVGIQRIKSVPWKLVFSAVLSVLFMYMAFQNWPYAISGATELWIILIYLFAPVKYGEVPSGLTLMLLLGAMGMIYWRDGFLDMLIGAAILGVGALIILQITELVTKQDREGTATIGVAFSLGLTLGQGGAAVVLLGTCILALFGRIYLTGRAKKQGVYHRDVIRGGTIEEQAVGEQHALFAICMLICSAVYIVGGLPLDQLVRAWLPWI